MRSAIPPEAGYKIVHLAPGVCSVHALTYQETFHPVIGPVAEAEALYVHQLRLAERLRGFNGEFVIWDVGLGAAANALTVLRAAREAGCSLRLISFDQTLEPLRFALLHADELQYLRGWETQLQEFIRQGRMELCHPGFRAKWEMHLADFPTLLAQADARHLAKPHAIMFDAFSPAKNPTMWTQPVFANLFGLLDPARPCALPTYSRSTMLRVTLLLAGFFVGRGHATGEKEETTLAANALELVEEPLGRDWLRRARRSSSAEPLWTPVYRQARLSPDTWEKLQQHPQFAQLA
jgi:tRNA U34 5-methylaminomethyl-2-thiouridine-forming methyltransferase MnmC